MSSLPKRGADPSPGCQGKAYQLRSCSMRNIQSMKSRACEQEGLDCSARSTRLACKSVPSLLPMLPYSVGNGYRRYLPKSFGSGLLPAKTTSAQPQIPPREAGFGSARRINRPLESMGLPFSPRKSGSAGRSVPHGTFRTEHSAWFCT